MPSGLQRILPMPFVRVPFTISKLSCNRMVFIQPMRGASPTAARSYPCPAHK